MTQRINFIEKRPFVLTYRKMVLVGGGIFGFLILFYGVQAVRLVSVEKKVVKLTAEVMRLKQEKEKRLKALEAAASAGSAAGAQAALVQYFDDPLSWSSFLNELTSQIPRSLWLTSLKAQEKKEARQGMLIEGRAEEASAVTGLVKALADSPYFEKVILTSLKQEKGDRGLYYKFTIDFGLSSQRKTAGKGI
jgi:Tfp pilus assembly protein PilN